MVNSVERFAPPSRASGVNGPILPTDLSPHSLNYTHAPLGRNSLPHRENPAGCVLRRCAAANTPYIILIPFQCTIDLCPIITACVFPGEWFFYPDHLQSSTHFFLASRAGIAAICLDGSAKSPSLFDGCDLPATGPFALYLVSPRRRQ